MPLTRLNQSLFASNGARASCFPAGVKRLTPESTPNSLRASLATSGHSCLALFGLPALLQPRITASVLPRAARPWPRHPPPPPLEC